MIQSKVEGQHQAFRFKSKISKKVRITVGKTLKNKTKEEKAIIMIKAGTNPQKDWNTAFLISAG
mgnify:FL=1|jgi:hypothetical protein